MDLSNDLSYEAGVSPAAAPTPMGVFNLRFEALFPQARTLGCGVCHPVHQLLPHRPAAALPSLFHNLPPRWVRQPPPCSESSPPWLPVWAPPTSLDECFFFISLVVGLPYSSIFCQFWLFFVLIVVVLLLVVRGGPVYLPTPPSWLEVNK